jgi:alcohol dehydrogenase (cytochrome c)
MYIVTPYPNVAYALDLTQPGFPAKWKYRPENAQAAVGEACCDVVNRGASYANGKIVYNLLDGHTVAVDAATGTELWRVKMGDVNRGETITMAPIVVKNKVIVGSSGEMGVRGWIAALDLETGKQIWRAYNIGPDADIKAGARFKPYYKQDQIANSGTASWPGDSWKVGGATVWGWVSYDPELNLIYHGTSNPGPWNGNQRPGDNKWSAAIIARDADTGDMVWAFQPTPPRHLGLRRGEREHLGRHADEWVDAKSARPLRPQRLRVHDRPRDRSGVGGAAVRADELVVGRGPRDGSAERERRQGDGAGKAREDICPSLEGGKNQQPAAFSPKTDCSTCRRTTCAWTSRVERSPHRRHALHRRRRAGGRRSGRLQRRVHRVGRGAGKKRWGIKEPFPVWSGALATAGNVVFYGTLDGWFKAVDATNGTVLWKFKVGSGIVGAPMTYTGPDGKQYVAVYSGIGGDMGLLIAGDVAANMPYDVRERGTTLPDLARYTSWGGMLFVFSL